MNGDAELLNFVYQNSQMGVETMNQLLPMVDNEAFKKQVGSQLKEYEKLNQEARGLLNSHGYDEKGISALEKMMAYLMIDFKTLTNKSASHLAEMLIQGSTMGIVDAIKRIRQYEGEVEKDVINLMKRLLKVEEGNVERLKEAL